ncbi:methyl-accepting chemotaxis sensory transducer with GAF sensor [Gloeothece citriformis PCC 7424]|uniref:Methyl-accepting chemotaxis sensory transducer with GAF sensor n=1 Tax=Gloeothece citriformis (strain PCC 7424) TaxID=65393 RepID=B7K8J4_GLOC7|nr:methyl-accepting chemotaxis protein [Gloeothece citriformis]ACK71192.1 methyl-accepting chemotaxis sensory transducer with GAF sensor [Gloeothece citriformis PCC 7424]
MTQTSRSPNPENSKLMNGSHSSSEEVEFSADSLIPLPLPKDSEDSRIEMSSVSYGQNKSLTSTPKPSVVKDLQIKFWDRRGLRYKAAFFACVLGILPATFVGVTTYSVVQNKLQQQASKNQNNVEFIQDLNSVYSHTRLTLLLTLTLSGFLVSVIGWWLADTVTNPIRSIAKGVRKIGRGELDTHLEIPGEDEFAILGENINAMTAQLKVLVQQQAEAVQQANLLAEIGGTFVTDEQQLNPVFNNALDGLRKILCAERAVIYRFRPDGSGYVSNESLESGWGSAMSEDFSDPCIPIEVLESYLKGRMTTIDDVFNSSSVSDPHLHLLARLQVRASIIVPLLKDRKLYGLLIVHHCINPHTWTEAEVSFTCSMADKLNIILDRLSSSLQRREEAIRSQNLRDITLKIASALSNSDVFDVTCREMRLAINSDRVIVYRFDANWKGTIIAESVAEGFPKALGSQIADPCFADRYVDKYRQGRVKATPNIYEAGLTDCHLRQLEPFEVKANLVAPILNQGELLGLLIAHQCSGPRYWEQGEIDFFSQIATQVGLAIDRTDLLEKQRQAEEEQRQAREQIQRRALELLMEVDPVSRGDLTIRASVTEDEIGTIADSYNATIESLRRIVTQVKNAALALASTTTDNEEAVRALSGDAIASAENISGALEQLQLMTESIRAVAANAGQAETAVQQATLTVEAGEEAMNRTVDGIMSIRETVAETAKKVKRLGESSQKISKVVNLISSFADQTNLLALNASIEAAHAGEEGRGFAVVADEVRSLARQSAEATAEIEGLVASIQAETNEVVAAMEAGTEQVVMGTKLVDETRKSLNQITAVSIQINELVEAITQAALEQSTTSESVTQMMAQVAVISDKTSLEATQVSDSFKQLLQVAQTLQESVKAFKVE